MNSLLANADSDPAQAVPARVLVADDDPGSCLFLCDGLASMGARAEACTDGMTALQRARTESFDLLLLDCRMPGAGALQILAALREDTQRTRRKASRWPPRPSWSRTIGSRCSTPASARSC
ncbi:response regulator [Rhodanobacter soli]